MNVLRQEIRTGLLVVFSIAVVMLVLLYLGAPGVFIPLRTYYVYVENASGLKPGADVALAGRKIGQVMQLFSPVPENERPEPKFETLIEMRVARSAKIYNNVKVSVTSSSLLGEMYVDFTNGVEASGLAEGMHHFKGMKSASLSEAIPQVLERLDPVIAAATTTMSVLQKTAANINQMTAPDGELPLAIAEYRKVGHNLEFATGPDGPLRETLANTAKLTGDNGKISTTLDNIRELTGPDSKLAKALENAEHFTADLNRNNDLAITLQNSRRATSELNNTLTDLRFKFSSIADNLEQASDTVKRQPWRLIWPSTKSYDEEQRKKPGTNALGGTPKARLGRDAR